MSATLTVVLSVSVLPSRSVTVVVITSPTPAVAGNWVTTGTPPSEAFSAALTSWLPDASGTVVLGAAGAAVMTVRLNSPELCTSLLPFMTRAS